MMQATAHKLNGSAFNSVDDLPREAAAEEYIIRVAVGLPDYAPDVFERSGLTHLHFTDEAHAAAFRVFAQQYRSGGIDFVTAAHELNKCAAFQPERNAAGWLLGLKIDDKAPATGARVPNEAAKIIDAAHKRQFITELATGRSYAMNGHTAPEAITAFRNGLCELERSIAGSPRDKFSLAELRKQFPSLNPPVVDGLFRQGETANVISTTKAGKSWLGYGLAISIIAGWEWLGIFKTSPGKVLLIDNELHPSTLAQRIPAVGDAMGIPKEKYETDLEIWTLRGNLRSLVSLAPEFDRIEPGKFKAIIFDAKYRFAIEGVSENDNAGDARFYNQLDAIAARTNAALVLIHHTSKGTQADKRVTDVGSGAGSQSRAADCHLILREHEEQGVGVLEAAVRSFAPVAPVALRWEFPLWVADNQVDPLRPKRQQSASEQRQAERDREGFSEIEGALGFGPATKKQLQETTGISRERLNRLLPMLHANGRITTNPISIRGNDCDEYQLAQPTDF